MLGVASAEPAEPPASTATSVNMRDSRRIIIRPRLRLAASWHPVSCREQTSRQSASTRSHERHPRWFGGRPLTANQPFLCTLLRRRRHSCNPTPQHYYRQEGMGTSERRSARYVRRVGPSRWPHARYPAPEGRRAPQGRLRTPRSRLHRYYLGHVQPCDARHAGGGRGGDRRWTAGRAGGLKIETPRAPVGSVGGGCVSSSLYWRASHDGVLPSDLDVVLAGKHQRGD